MHGTFEPKPERPESPPVVKREVVYLTNRAPIAIVEADWIDVAQGGVGYMHDLDYGWSINIRLRRHKNHKRQQRAFLLYATYVNDSPNEDDCDRVRVGRLLSTWQVADKLWTHIQEIGDELRERIVYTAHVKRVVNAVDAMFEHLDAQEEN